MTSEKPEWKNLESLSASSMLNSCKIHHTLIRSLNLYNNQLGTKGAAVLGLSISKLPSLIEISLDLGMNVISDGFFILFGTILSTS